MLIRRYSLFLLLALLLSACASQKPAVPTSSWEWHRDNLQQLQHWQAEGKLGLKLEQSRHKAYFDWQQSQDNFVIRLSGPLGQGTSWLRQQNGLTTLESSDGQRRQANSAEALMQNSFGWQVPVSQLRHWIKGIPAPTQLAESINRNELGLLANLQQLGWQLSFSRYGQHGNWQLPGKIIAVREGIRLTIIVKRWYPKSSG